MPNNTTPEDAILYVYDAEVEVYETLAGARSWRTIVPFEMRVSGVRGRAIFEGVRSWGTPADKRAAVKAALQSYPGGLKDQDARWIR